MSSSPGDVGRTGLRMAEVRRCKRRVAVETVAMAALQSEFNQPLSTLHAVFASSHDTAFEPSFTQPRSVMYVYEDVHRGKVGEEVGLGVGLTVGEEEGAKVGLTEGVEVGANVGSTVG